MHRGCELPLCGAPRVLAGHRSMPHLPELVSGGPRSVPLIQVSALMPGKHLFLVALQGGTADFTVTLESPISCLDHVQEAKPKASTAPAQNTPQPPPCSVCIPGTHGGGRQGGREVAPLTLGTQDLSRARRWLLLVIFPEISPSLVFGISVIDKQTKIYLFGDYLY